ncbi:MAG: DUF4287 domain-containing protein [Anaerolineales bacterium]|nr:DUF4287 domain-containing protein [Anaerolineales bacterium]
MTTPDPAVQTMIDNLERKYGKTLAEWTRIARTVEPQKHGQIVKHLKAEHGIGHGYANLIAQETLRRVISDVPAEDDLVAAMFAGSKEKLRPIYARLLEAAQGFGADVEVAPKKTYVSLRRRKQFALVQPSTRTRVDLGLNLPATEPQGVLEAVGSFNAMCTHRIRLEGVEMVDETVLDWLRAAYEAAA